MQFCRSFILVLQAQADSLKLMQNGRRAEILNEPIDEGVLSLV